VSEESNDRGSRNGIREEVGFHRPENLQPVRILELGRDWRPSTLPESVEEFLRWLGSHSLLCVPGRDQSRTRLVSTLLHGNEPSGVRAVHQWLRAGRKPAVDVLIFIGAVETALTPPGFAHRFLPGSLDMNRCWLPPFETPEGVVAHEVLRLIRQTHAESLVDIHNNTGHNPAYGVGVVPGAAELNLTSLFGDRFVHSPLRLGTLAEATCNDFPSIAIECGRSHDPAADAVALAGLERYLETDVIDYQRVVPDHMSVLVDPVRVCVREGVELAFGDGPVAGADVTVDLDIDRHNFEELAPETEIGWLGERRVWPLEALDETGRDLSKEFFDIREGRMVTRQPIIPIMMTTNRDNALSDCLFYVVKRGQEIHGQGVD
jgi:hypothetical protein